MKHQLGSRTDEGGHKSSSRDQQEKQCGFAKTDDPLSPSWLTIVCLSCSDSVNSIFAHHKDPDGFLYFTYRGEDVFG